MKLLVERIGLGKDSTLGFLTTEGFHCFTLEDEKRTKKVRGETAIPAGTYAIGVRKDSPKFHKLDLRWDWHHGMLWLKDVPGFEFVYIHTGNTDDHTEGCLLVGVNPQIDKHGEFTIGGSRAAYKELYTRVRDAAGTGDLTIEIRDRRPA